MLPREKCLKYGVDNLSDMELIAIIVGSGVKGKDFMSVAKSTLYLIRKRLEDGKSLSVTDIDSISGIGPVVAMRILCGIELGRRLYEPQDANKCFVRDSADAYGVLKDIGRKKQEYVVALFLNSRFELIKRRTICIGSIDGVSIAPRDVIIPALELNANSVIIAHNHPSGDPTPSREDEDITRKLKMGMDLVGITLLDHIVIGKDEWKRIEI
ncbi:MAG TPA: DNA repair protein RadC [Candidatus Dojkabacteria bacterium]|jgi:DNA repair protein RadC|nr:DNA repair protein RadC [Candidatus Dojkabacteria bacterium]